MIKTILFFLCIAFSVAGIVIASITAGWSLATTVFLIFSIALVALYLWSKQHQLWQKRSTKQNTNTVIAIAIILTIVVLINILGIRHNKRWDFSKERTYKLSALSEITVRQLKQPLEVIVFNRDIDPNLQNLLEQYRRITANFQFKFVDPEYELGLAKQYGVKSLGEIYLKYGDKKQKLVTQNSDIRQAVTEIQLTNGIERIKRERIAKIYLLQGHGEAPNRLIERGIAQIVTNLENRGNQVLELNLATSGLVPNDADLIIIAGATRKLLTAEVGSLQTYLSTGGSLLLLLSPNTDIGITPLLQEWGLELDDRLIVDGSGASEIMGFGPAVAIVNNYGDHPITNSFDRGISVFPESRPLKIRETTGVISTPLAISNEQTWAESDIKNAEITFDPNQDLSGPLNIAIAFEKQQSKAARMVVFGSSTFVTNGWFEQQLNSDLAINSIYWLLGENKEVLTIRPRNSANRRINLNPMQVRSIKWLALRIVPLSALIMAFFVWHKRR